MRKKGTGLFCLKSSAQLDLVCYNLRKKEGMNMEELKKEDIRNIFHKRDENSNKGNFGYVGIMGGCIEYSGAVKLANLSSSALTSGAGVVRIIVPKEIANGVMPYLLEQTLFTIESKDGHMIFNEEEIDKSLEKLKALAIGMGWGESNENAKILSYILETKDIPVVIDADGLNTLAKMDKSILNRTKCKVILTPHPKEFERISGYDFEDIKNNPQELAIKFAKEYNVILLLKGHTTTVTDGKTTYLVKRGCAGMATAGSGDVLSGILVGLLGYNEPTVLTISAGAYLAGLAGEMAEKELNDISMKTSDTIAKIPEAINEIRK